MPSLLLGLGKVQRQVPAITARPTLQPSGCIWGITRLDPVRLLLSPRALVTMLLLVAHGRCRHRPPSSPCQELSTHHSLRHEAIGSILRANHLLEGISESRG